MSARLGMGHGDEHWMFTEGREPGEVDDYR